MAGPTDARPEGDDPEAFPPGLIARVVGNFLDLHVAMGRLAPGGAVLEDAELLLVYSGPLLPYFNGAFPLSRTADPAALIARAAAFFAAQGQRWAMITEGSVDPVLAVATRGAGLAARPSPGLVLTPLRGAPPAIPGLQIAPVTDPAGLRVYNDTMTTAFGDEWAREEIVRTRSLIDAPGMTHYLARLDGRPVGTAMRFASQGVAGVYNVGTLPAWRRRGIGEALTWRAALDGVAEGCDASALQSSAEGLALYRRMGYRPALTYHIWLPATPGLPPLEGGSAE